MNKEVNTNIDAVVIDNIDDYYIFKPLIENGTYKVKSCNYMVGNVTSSNDVDTSEVDVDYQSLSIQEYEYDEDIILKDLFIMYDDDEPFFDKGGVIFLEKLK